MLTEFAAVDRRAWGHLRGPVGFGAFCVKQFG